MKLHETLSYKPAELAFGTSGLRGLVTDMTDLECYINARGFVEYLKAHDNLQDGETVYLAGDLRDSSPRITAVMVAALQDSNLQIVYCGKIPTPAVAFYALQNNAPCIMVTGSHIPADRNGIKFYKREGEVLKADEADIKAAVAQVRQELYDQAADESAFTSSGSLNELPELPAVDDAAAEVYAKRYIDTFGADALAGKQIVFYQHSAVGRDLLVEILEALGAEVKPVGRSDTFIPIDSENVGDNEKAYFAELSREYPNCFAIVSTDGDSDRPFVIDATGTFHRGDVLGCITAEFLGAKFVAIPVSCNDAVDEYCQQKGITKVGTKIGSPYVVSAMQTADKNLEPLTGWEVNGGFLLGSDTKINGVLYKALPTRDAALPIIAALVSASDQKTTVAELFARLPRRFTGGALIDDVPDAQIEYFRAHASDLPTMERLAKVVFKDSPLGDVKKLDVTDGLRLIFASGDVIHLRPSGNAPQVRVYSNASTQQQADDLAAAAVAPNGYIEQLLQALV